MLYVLTWAKPLVVAAYELGAYGHFVSLLLSHISLLIVMARCCAVVAAGVELRYSLYTNRRNAGK